MWGLLCRYDDRTQLYLAVTNPSVDRYGSNPDARNILVLVYSENLVDWRTADTLLVPNDGLDWDTSLWKTSYMYVDWVFDRDDLLLVIRTSYDGARSFHDSNRITFKRVERYAQLLPPSRQSYAASAVV